MLPAEGQQHTDLGTGSESCHRRFPQHGIASCRSGCRSKHLQRRVRELALAHPLCTVTSQRMSHLMP